MLQNSSLIGKVLFQIILITTLILVSCFVLFIVFSIQQEYRWLEAKIDSTVNQLDYALRLPLWNIDLEASTIILENTLKDEDFSSLRIQASDKLFEDLVLTAEQRPSPSLSRSVTIYHESHPLATLYLGANDQRIKGRILYLLLVFSLFILILECALAGSLYVILWKTVFQPLKKIRVYASAVSGYQKTQDEISKNEMKALENDIKYMVLKLDERYTDLLAAETLQRTALEEKKILLEELNHRVKNNLSIIYSVLDFQKGRFSDPSVDKMLLAMQNRIHAIGSLHEWLYKSDDLTRIDFSAYLKDIIQTIAQAFVPKDDNCFIALDYIIPPMILDLETAQACGLLITELLNNAYQHGFPNKQSGKIQVELLVYKERFRIIIKDTGFGMSEINFGSLGFGLVIAKTLATQIKSELSFDSTPYKGTICTLEVPLAIKTEETE